MTWHNLERTIKSRSSIKAAGDVAARRAFYRVIESQSMIVTYGGGEEYVAQSNSSVNRFKAI